MTRSAEVVVVGAGVMGAATARALARAGRDVVVVEQFEVGHPRGSSHGTSRIFRLSYSKARWVQMAQEALPRWRELEAERSTRLLELTGGIDVGAQVGAHAQALAACDAPFERLDGADAAARFRLRLPGDADVLFQPDAGIVRAHDAWNALVASAVDAGCLVEQHTRVHGLEVHDAGVQVTTDAGRIQAAVAVVTAGAWARPLLRSAGIHLDVVASRETVAYFRLPEPPVSVVEWDDVPRYALAAPGVGLKAGEHHAGPATNPDHDGAPDQSSVARVAAWVRERFPDADPQPIRAETCLYTNTADHDFVVRAQGPVVVGSPCSGHGFKFAPLVGERIAALAVARL